MAPLMINSRVAPRADAVESIAMLATRCLHEEIDTHPKPGMVSHIDNGSHADMDAALLHRSAEVLTPFWRDLAAAAAVGHEIHALRRIGMAAEQTMFAATAGVNTHRGAIFGLGLLVAAAALRQSQRIRAPLGRIVASRWGVAILRGPLLLHSHGSSVARRYGVGGARAEAARGFPSVYEIGIPALIEGSRFAPGDSEAVRVHACMALIARVDDTNVLFRGGQEGLAFAQRAAAEFLAAGGVGRVDWRESAEGVHRQFVERRLSPGGCADLLAMTLFVNALRWSDSES
jgi:triphosphoribosyl-dephospho-CoA synthase